MHHHRSDHQHTNTTTTQGSEGGPRFAEGPQAGNNAWLGAIWAAVNVNGMIALFAFALTRQVKGREMLLGSCFQLHPEGNASQTDTNGLN